MTDPNKPGRTDAGLEQNAAALPPHKDHPAKLTGVPEIDFEQISGGGDMVLIRLGTAHYELRRTRSGRLVLHK